MQNSMGLVWGLIIAVVVLGGGYLLWANSPDSTNNVVVTRNTNTTSTTTNTASGTSTNTGTNIDGTNVGGSVSVGTGAPMTVTVTYNGESFTPRSVTIARGGTVTWRNESNGNMWVASAQHPTHAIYSGTTREQHCPGGAATAFDQCVGGANYSFKFDKTGSWNYHDHINPSVFGTVVVQ